ncbi:hypothetical protein K505DRAFT_55457 [Melanomma pulvis-pyrius CBS 109.77]|uniref:DUF7580 domain-containing protein n=1 Tax=Melanomma pulvis-pyrius CBS 109.77 TaxID=1314802 RepID=A0A6A6X877_9PLEO|nr:hypothetical protein K505DRAFT_55457 [Melanomma pulvis-pyrius CBS 109.77]
MSGFEIVGVVFGVLPILIEAIKAYSDVASSFHTFRHYSKEVRTVQIQFKCHHGIFINECRLLLSLIEDERGAKDMLDDGSDHRWTSKQMNDKLNEVLKDNFDLCRSIIEASKEIVDGIREDLKTFDVLVEGKDKGESIKSAIRRLRNAVRICFDKSKYEKNLASLRDRTSELTQLRAHIGVFQQQKACVEGVCSSRSILPPRIKNFRTASQKLHEALSDAWCCGDLGHGNHFAKICLDAQEVHTGVRLDLTISCQEIPQQANNRALTEPPIWLYVQSISIDTTPCAQMYPEATAALKGQLSQGTTSSPVSSGSKKKASSDAAQALPCNKKRRRVRFADTSPESEAIIYSELSTNAVSEAISQAVARQTSSEINLCHTKNICHYLKQNIQLCGQSLTKHCVGYLESPKTYRHMFYLQKELCSNETSNRRPNKPDQTSVISIFDLMGQGVDDVVTVVDQLKLAHKTALAILQFNATPWLVQRWRLKDLSYFGSRNTFDEDALKTLHLSSQISSATGTDTGTMEGVEEVVGAFSEEDYFGINNTTLFFLGVALLELAHWKPLESLSTPQDPNEILTARRLASRPTPLGSRYQEIARKCLQCNFGFGTDLNKKELQTAVYGEVVCQLEKMIKTLSI